MMGKETFDENSAREWPASPGPQSPTSESVNERLLPEDGGEKKKTPPPPGTATFSSFVV